MNLGVNGRFYAARVTGVQRFAREVSARLYESAVSGTDVPHAAADSLRVSIFVPRGADASQVPESVTRVRGRLRGHLWEQLELPRRARAAGCDLVLHLSNTAPLRGGPHVLVIHDVFALTHPEWFSTRFALGYRLALAGAARRAAHIVTVSHWARAEIARVLGIPAMRISVVPEGVEPFQGPAPADAVARVLARWNLPERYLLAVGAGDPRKNLAFLVRGLERWRGRGEPPPLVVAGAHDPRVHARPRAAGGSVSWPAAAFAAARDAPVRFVGHVSDDELRALYTGAAVFCFPSLGEGFGRPPLEAMACGAPVIAADYGAAPEILADGAHILPLEPDAWIDAIATLLDEGGERARLIERGRARAGRFRWDAAVDGVLDACRAAAWDPRPAEVSA